MAAGDLASAITAPVPRSWEGPRAPFWLKLTFIGAIAYVPLTAIATLYQAITTLLATTVSVDLPVGRFWPKLLTGIKLDPAPSAKIVDGGFTHGVVGMSGLHWDIRIWLAAGHIAEGLTYAAIGLAIAILCRRLIRGDPFGPALTRTMSRTGIVVLVGGIGWQILYGIGGWRASLQALQILGWSAPDVHPDIVDPLDVGWPKPGDSISVDFWPLWIALALFAIAGAFSYGERLQRERVALAAANVALRRDTEGLV